MENCVAHAAQLVHSKLEQEAVATTYANMDAVDADGNACGEGMDVNDSDADSVDVDAADDADAEDMDKNATEDKTCHRMEQNFHLPAL
jgi:hypothetical protein